MGTSREKKNIQLPVKPITHAQPAIAAGIEQERQSQATGRPLGSLLFWFSAPQIPIHVV